MKLQTKKKLEQEQLFQHIIKKTSEDCKERDNEFFYNEVLMQLAPYLFPSEENAIQARGRMLRALNSARHR